MRFSYVNIVRIGITYSLSIIWKWDVSFCSLKNEYVMHIIIYIVGGLEL